VKRLMLGADDEGTSNDEGATHYNDDAADEDADDDGHISEHKKRCG
jgi:hypothetical protein